MRLSRSVRLRRRWVSGYALAKQVSPLSLSRAEVCPISAATGTRAIASKTQMPLSCKTDEVKEVGTIREGGESSQTIPIGSLKMRHIHVKWVPPICSVAKQAPEPGPLQELCVNALMTELFPFRQKLIPMMKEFGFNETGRLPPSMQREFRHPLVHFRRSKPKPDI